MKNILITLIIFIISKTSYAQYPKYTIDQDVKVIMFTIEQARKIDNKLELLKYYQKIDIDMSKYDSLCEKTISEKDIVISKQDTQISNYDNLIINKDNQIKNLNEQVKLNEKDVKLCDEIISNKDKEIELHISQIKKLKTKMTIIGSIGGVIISKLIYDIVTK